MKPLFCFTIIFVTTTFFSANVIPQTSSLYMPKELKRAYEKDTRSYDGKPGENYFQNRTDYTIQADFDPYTRLLTGNEKVTLENNSPDTLKSVVIRLNPNILKKGATRKKLLDPGDVNEGVELTRLKIGDTEFDLENNPPNLDQNNLVVRLTAPLPPNSKTALEIDWNYTFQANSNIREGRYQETTYFIAYWYPKIAVYDDIEGWDRHIYNAEQEFYHEYGDFDVNITVPADFYVWSSGLLQNAREVLSQEKSELFEKSKATDEVVHILEIDDVSRGDLPRQNLKKTWRFKAGNLPDFAFAVSDTYLWDATSVQVGDKRVHVHAVYYRDSKDFHEVAEISRETIRLLSDSVMGIDFPYPQMTAFNGHYGMEFPMMVNDGDAETRNGTLFVTAHEIAHTYFPFYVGTNEQKYAWMDEGLITYLPKEIEDALSSDEDHHAFNSNIRTYSYYCGSKYDVPLMIPSDQLTGLTYMYVSYSRSGVALYVLENILGKELFQNCLVEFMNRWAGRHPTAYDFFYTFEDVSKKDLSWFWNPWFFEFGYPDLSVASVDKTQKGYTIQIDRSGTFPTPVNLTITYADDSTHEINETARVWSEQGEMVKISLETDKKVKKVEVNTLTVPDNNRDNNSYILE